MSETLSDPVPRRWPALLLAVAALAWLAAVAGIAGAGLSALPAMTAAQAAVAAGGLLLDALPPLAVTILALAWFMRTSPVPSAALQSIDTRHGAARDASDALAQDIVALDDMLDRIGGRYTALREAAAGDAATLEAGIARLDASALRLTEAASLAKGAGDTLSTALPATAERVEALRTALGETGDETTRQLAETETMLAAVWAASDDAARRHDAVIDAAATRVTALSSAADRVVERLGTQSAELQRVVGIAFDGTAAALDRTREGVEMQTAALLASVGRARGEIDHIGGDAGRAVGERMAEVLAAATALGDSLAAQEIQSRAFADGATRSFNVLDARLANAAAATGNTLDGLATRLTGVYTALDAIGTPLGSTNSAVGDLEAAMARLDSGSAAALATLGSDLPATGDGIAQLSERIAALHTEVAALNDPLSANDATAAAIAAQLATALETARAVETATGSAGLTALTDLIEVLARVREVAALTSGTMRTTLAEVVAEAEAALAEVGTSRARAAFGEPVAQEIAAVRAAADDAAQAAQAAAERVTQRLLALTATIATVEARIDEVDTRYDIALRDDLAKRAQALIESLQSGAIDLTKLLDIDVGDEAWSVYLKGDRGVFARRAVRLLNSDSVRKIQRHYEHDLPFREQAVRYITEFETLLKRVMPVREGKALTTTLLSSDIGKLYVVLAQATESMR